MNVIIFIFKSRYRYSHTGNLFTKKIGDKIILLPVVGIFAIILEPLINKFKIILNIKVLYTDAEFEKRKDVPRLWWNTPEEVSEIHISRKPIFLCSSPFENLNECRFYPVINKKDIDGRKSWKFNKKIIFMGEVEIPNNKNVLLHWDKWRIYILNDLRLITKRDFWSKNFDYYSITEKYEFYRGFSNLIRFECMSFLIANGINVEVYGNDWKKLGINSRKSMYDSNKRKNLYNGSICLDFGSKSGIDSLYQRSIEIIENNGVLVQIEREDSNEIYGNEIYECSIFNNLEELLVLLHLISENGERAAFIREKYDLRFQKNQNFDRSNSKSVIELGKKL